jgi:transposase-like protein
MDTTTLVLKTDSRGRVSTPPERRAALLAEFARSGLSATQFAALVGVRYQTFATWVQEHRRRAAAVPAASKPVRFAEVVPAAVAPSRALRVVLAGGAVIELTDPLQVPLAAQLIQALV